MKWKLAFLEFNVLVENGIIAVKQPMILEMSSEIWGEVGRLKSKLKMEKILERADKS